MRHTLINKIYYISNISSCDKLKNKQDFLLNVYPKNWVDNKLYVVNMDFNLREKKT